jgi:RecA/RadA recombinase
MTENENETETTVEAELLATLKEGNTKLIQAMIDAEYGFDPNQLLKLRVDLLTDVLIDSQIVDQEQLELRWELMLSEVLSEVINQITKQNEILEREANE